MLDRLHDKERKQHHRPCHHEVHRPPANLRRRAVHVTVRQDNHCVRQFCTKFAFKRDRSPTVPAATKSTVRPPTCSHRVRHDSHCVRRYARTMPSRMTARPMFPSPRSSQSTRRHVVSRHACHCQTRKTDRQTGKADFRTGCVNYALRSDNSTTVYLPTCSGVPCMSLLDKRLTAVR